MRELGFPCLPLPVRVLATELWGAERRSLSPKNNCDLVAALLKSRMGAATTTLGFSKSEDER